MDFHLSQASHNKDFLEFTHQNHPEKYFDWKITIAFYVALHLLKSLALKRGKPLGDSHSDIRKALNNRNKSKLFQFPPRQWIVYEGLFNYAHTSRYDGFIDPDSFLKQQQINFAHTMVLLEEFISYMKSQGIELSQTNTIITSKNN